MKIPNYENNHLDSIGELKSFCEASNLETRLGVIRSFITDRVIKLKYLGDFVPDSVSDYDNKKIEICTVKHTLISDYTSDIENAVTIAQLEISKIPSESLINSNTVRILAYALKDLYFVFNMI